MSGAVDFSYLSVDLDQIRQSLIRFEETIIFSFIERAQYKVNDAIYTKSLDFVSGGEQQQQANDDGRTRRLPFMLHLLRETEKVHARVRRFTSPDEHAFFPHDLPPPALPPLDYPADLLHPGPASAINVNERILAMYVERIVPLLCAPGDDANYGSSSLCDINCLSALSKRIHYGKFVAESKFRSMPAAYGACIASGDRDGLMRLLTDAPVEQRVLRRVRTKAATFGQDVSGVPSADAREPPVNYKVAPDLVVMIYRDLVIPMTKQVQVDYLLRRLDGLPLPRPSSLPAPAVVAQERPQHVQQQQQQDGHHQQQPPDSLLVLPAAAPTQPPPAAAVVVVAALGPMGTFSFEATTAHFAGRNHRMLACETLPAVVDAVADGQADYALLPVENSTEGPVAAALDALLRRLLDAAAVAGASGGGSRPAVAVCSERLLQVRHHVVVGRRCGGLASVRRVYSHPQALAQCRRWLADNLPNALQVAVSSTAAAAQQAAGEDDAAAICGLSAAEQYDVDVVQSDVQDDANNTTRFLVLCRAPLASDAGTTAAAGVSSAAAAALGDGPPLAPGASGSTAAAAVAAGTTALLAFRTAADGLGAALQCLCISGGGGDGDGAAAATGSGSVALRSLLSRPARSVPWAYEHLATISVSASAGASSDDQRQRPAVQQSLAPLLLRLGAVCPRPPVLLGCYRFPATI